MNAGQTETEHLTVASICGPTWNIIILFLNVFCLWSLTV